MSEAKAPAVYAGINAVMAHMAKEGIGKDRKNEQQRYNFRGIDDVYNTLCSVLAEHKVMMLPYVQAITREERTTKNGGGLNYTILTVDFDIVSAVDGTKHTVRMIGEAMDAADKSSNKAQSAALKYAALQVFMIPTEGDNDADATTHDVAPRQQQAQQQRQQPQTDEAAAWAAAFIRRIKATDSIEALNEAERGEHGGMQRAQKERPELHTECLNALMAQRDKLQIADANGPANY